jgi:hypothetical protein
MGRLTNRVERITLAGGLIGALVTNSKVAFEKRIDASNAEGWNLCHVEPLSGANLFMLLIRIIILVLTLGLFTLGASYLLIFERDVQNLSS